MNKPYEFDFLCLSKYDKYERMKKNLYREVAYLSVFISDVNIVKKKERTQRKI